MSTFPFCSKETNKSVIKLLPVLFPIGFQLTDPMLGVANVPEVSAITTYSLALVIVSYGRVLSIGPGARKEIIALSMSLALYL